MKHHTQTVLASATSAALNSNVKNGGGTDDTAALQQVLDSAASAGGVRLVMDGAALVSSLRVHSNTTIECLNADCGFFQAPQSNSALLINANPAADAIIDRNITLIGGTYNQNCLHQEHHVPPDVHYTKADHYSVGLAFFGVENLVVRDITIRNFRTFAFLMSNWVRVTIENVHLDLPDLISHGNQDGIHVQGPGRQLILRNIRGKTGDDFIALNGDEESNGQQSWFHPKCTVGPMTDILVDGLMVDDASQVVRILSRENSQDRITIRNVSGNYRSFGFYLSAWDYQKRGMHGDFGSIVIENVDLRQTKADYTYTDPFLFRISGRHKSLALRNINYFDPTDDRSIIHIEGNTDVPDLGNTPAEVESLVIDGLHIQDGGDAPQTRPYIRVAGHVKRMVVRNTEVCSDKNKGATFIATEGPHAKIDRLLMRGVDAVNVESRISDAENRIADWEDNGGADR